MAQNSNYMSLGADMQQQLLALQLSQQERARAAAMQGRSYSTASPGGFSTVPGEVQDSMPVVASAIQAGGPSAALSQLLLRMFAYAPENQNAIGRYATAEKGRQLFGDALGQQQRTVRAQAQGQELQNQLIRNQIQEAMRQPRVAGNGAIGSTWGGGAGGGQRVGDMMLGRGIGESPYIQALMRRKMESDLEKSVWDNERQKYLDLQAERTQKEKDSRQGMAFDLMLRAMKKALRSGY